MIRVGIPRALLYYQYCSGWKTFFERLGAEVVVSEPTNKVILNSGVSRAVADTCLPVKILLGHLISLIGDCDYIFVPAITSLGEKTYNCSKIIGLPNIARALIPESPVILDPEINLEKGRYHLYYNIYKTGHHFTSNPFRIEKAVQAALESHSAYRRKMSDSGITRIQAISGNEDKDFGCTLGKENSMRIAVIGHPYVLYDDYVNHNLISKLRSMKARVFVPEMVPEAMLDAATTRLAGQAHWSFENDIIGAGEYYLEQKIDGIVNLSVFGCGPDSMMVKFLEHRAKELGVAFLPLSIDEHSSEGALLSRLEAFIDMAKRRERVCV
jgi:predicted nucleotide-binding protein (sugar kinase/HSP70/actin superfamily)